MLLALEFSLPLLFLPFFTSNEVFYLDGAYGNDETWHTKVVNSKGTSNYAWLFNNLKDCEGYGCSQNPNTTTAYGYWTSMAHDSRSSYALVVDHYGNLHITYVNINYHGVRPVITVSKSQILP